MNLKKVNIYGFRSIENMEIDLSGDGHKVLVGKNESGKSNILKALNLLSGNMNFEKKDKKELYDGNAFVRFTFELDNNEIEKCVEKFYKKFIPSPETELAKNITIQSFFKKHSKHILYEIICPNKSRWVHWRLDKNQQFTSKWYSLDKDIESPSNQKLLAGSYVNEDYINNLNSKGKESIEDHLSPLKIEDVYNFLCKTVKEVCAPDNYVYPVTFWRYDSTKHDLPSYVKREDFLQDPDSCIPLKNMFLLAGIQEDEIHEKVSTANEQGHNRLSNLIEDVNKKTNKYIKRNWREYKEIKIELRSDGEDIAIGIQDSKNAFDFRERSDGFRRFISFLLLMSTAINTNRRNKPLILIDEPETGLHPSSAKDLRSTLIKLGKTNTVIYATHSISMIDTESIENNLIISKEKENTTFETAKEDGTSPAENIYQAIGHSIYESLKQKNILVEGYTDKEILKSFMTGELWKQYGICYASGVSNIKNIISLLELANRKYFVLSDADKPAIQSKKNMENPPFWYTYKDLHGKAITIEDFYTKDFFQTVAKEILREHGISDQADTWLQENGRMKCITNFLERQETDKKRISSIKKEIKQRCIKKFKKRDIDEEKLKQMLDKLSEKIGQQSNQD